MRAVWLVWVLGALGALVPCGMALAQGHPLAGYLQAVLASHPEARQQQAQLAGALQDVEVARQQFWPTPSLSLERVQPGPQDVQYQADRQVMVLRLQQPLWTGGRLTAGLDKAQAAVQVRQAALAESRQQLVLSTLESWGAWCVAEARLAVLSASLDLHRELQAKVQRRVQEGASAPTELTMTEGRVAQVVAQRSSQQAQREVARSRLSQLLGQPLALAACPGWPRWQGTALPDMALASRLAGEVAPALRRLQAQTQVVRQELQERKADLWPEVFVRAEHQQGHYTFVNYPTTQRVFVGMSSRLGAGLSNLRQIEAMQQRLQAAEQEIEGGQRKVAEQVQALWIEWQVVQARLPALAQQVQSTGATQQAWERQFLAGRKSWLDVMNAAREAMQAELEWTEAAQAELSLQWRLGLLVQGVDEVVSLATAAAP